MSDGITRREVIQAALGSAFAAGAFAITPLSKLWHNGPPNDYVTIQKIQLIERHPWWIFFIRGRVNTKSWLGYPAGSVVVHVVDLSSEQVQVLDSSCLVLLDGKGRQLQVGDDPVLLRFTKEAIGKACNSRGELFFPNITEESFRHTNTVMTLTFSLRIEVKNYANGELLKDDDINLDEMHEAFRENFKFDDGIDDEANWNTERFRCGDRMKRE